MPGLAVHHDFETFSRKCLTTQQTHVPEVLSVANILKHTSNVDSEAANLSVYFLPERFEVRVGTFMWRAEV